MQTRHATPVAHPNIAFVKQPPLTAYKNRRPVGDAPTASALSLPRHNGAPNKAPSREHDPGAYTRKKKLEKHERIPQPCPPKLM